MCRGSGAQVACDSGPSTALPRAAQPSGWRTPASPCGQTGLARSCARRQPRRATAAVDAGVPGRFYGAHIARPAPRVSDGLAACLSSFFPVLRFALSRLLSLRPGSRTFAIQKHVHAPVACMAANLKCL